VGAGGPRFGEAHQEHAAAVRRLSCACRAGVHPSSTRPQPPDNTPPWVQQTAGALLWGRLADPFGDAAGNEIARMLKRDDAWAAARRFFIADRQHRAAL
jgi:hypothetical protein